MTAGRHRAAGRGGLSAERGAAAGSVILVLRFITGSVLNYAFNLALAWLLVPEEFGTVSAAQNVMLFAAGALTAGLPWALTVRLSASGTTPSQAAALLRTAVLGNVVIASALAGVLVLTQVSGHRVLPTGSGAIVVVVAAEILLLGLNAVIAGALQGTKRFGGLGGMHALEILVKVVVATVLVAATGSGALGVVIGFFVGSVTATCVGLRGLRGLLPGRGPLAPWRSVTAAGPIWVATAGFTVLLTVDVLGLSFFGGGTVATATALAAYQVCSTLARAPYFVSDALVDAVFPFMAADPRDVRAVHGWFLEAVRWIPVLLVPLQLVLVLVPEPFLRLLFPASYAASATVLRVLTLGTLGLLLTNALVKGLYARAHQSSAARVVGPVVVVEVVLLAFLVPRHAAVGAATAYAVSCWLAVLGLAPAYLRGLGGALARARAVLAARYLASLAPAVLLLLLASRLPDVFAVVLVAVAISVHVLSARRWAFVRDSDLARISPTLVTSWPLRTGRTTA
ncbi:oligosaccharide flippase family protein [Kineococcus sp. R86509]|uniref:oligosaccharide flippase family protein n=1 Tax=Kineococcus sp. R86509 TaxID=3093851 RepID=UPI0036D37352